MGLRADPKINDGKGFGCAKERDSPEEGMNANVYSVARFIIGESLSRVSSCFICCSFGKERVQPPPQTTAPPILVSPYKEEGNPSCPISSPFVLSPKAHQGR